MSMRAHSTAVQDSLKDYRFGSANDIQIPSHRLSDSQVRMGSQPNEGARRQKMAPRRNQPKNVEADTSMR